MIYDFIVCAFGFIVFFGLIFLMMDMVYSVTVRFFSECDDYYSDGDDDAGFDDGFDD